MSIRRVLFLISLVTLALAAFPQQPRGIAVSSIVDVAERRPLAVVEPVKCGADGRIHALFAMSRAQSVTTISEDGKCVSTSGLNAIPEPIAGVGFVDFAPAESGHALVLALKPQGEKRGSHSDYYVVRFKDDGTYESAVRLNMSFSANSVLKKIAMFETGDLAIAGYGDSKAFVVLFDSSGEFRKKVTLPGDLTSDKTQNGAQTPTIARKADTENDILPRDDFEQSMDLSSLQSADDGNVYLMRPKKSGPVFRISAGGSVQRIPLKSPDEAAHLVSIKVNQGTIAAEYSARSYGTPPTVANWITFTDVSNGKLERIVRYTESDNTGVGMVCFRAGNIVFLTTGPGGNLRLVTGAPE